MSVLGGVRTHVYRVPLSPEEVVRSAGTGVIDDWELSHVDAGI